MQNPQQGVRKAPFIYPEYLSNMTAKMKPSAPKSEEHQTPVLLSAMNNYNGLLFPTGLGEFTKIDELKRPPSSSTSTTAGETVNSDFHAMPTPKTRYRRRSSSITVSSDPPRAPAQSMMYASTNPMNRGMFMAQKMPNLMKSPFSGGFSNLFSKNKAPIPSTVPPASDDAETNNHDDDGDESTSLSPPLPSRRLFPASHVLLMPGSGSASAGASGSPANAPASPFRNISLALRTVAGPSSNNAAPAVASRDNHDCAASGSSVASSIFSHASQASHLSQLKDHNGKSNNIRVKGGARMRAAGQSPRRTCASCVCRDQKLSNQRKEIDHLKNVISDLLVLSMESRNTAGWSDDDDDDSLEDLPLPPILEESAPQRHEGDLMKAAQMALLPSRQTFHEDPQDPLKTDELASSTAILQMSHSLRLKQSFKRGASTKIPKKMRHLRIQVNGNWGYYSGPTPERDLALLGCVVRFDNGDLYLGNMENSCFHGPGAYYPKGGRVLRGDFRFNKLE